MLIDTDQIATKTDIHDLQNELKLLEQRVEARFTLLQWMLMVNLLFSLTILGKLFLTH